MANGIFNTHHKLFFLRSYLPYGFLFSDFFILVLLRFISMSQSNMLTKEGVEKSLSAITQKLRIKVTHFDNTALVQGYSKTLIDRCMNPHAQIMKNLLFMLPRIWNMKEHVIGADLGLGRFQFDFDTEEDIIEVMKMEPFHFDHWMVSLVRWEPHVNASYPSDIKFWIKVIGVPLHFWAELTFWSIGMALGKVIEVDLNSGIVQVVVNGFKPLCFEISM